MSDGLLLIGAAGLVGGQVLQQANGRSLGLLVRRPLPKQPANIRSYLTENSDDWPGRIAAIKPQTLICCIGTTMKKAGGQVQFRAVDQDLVLACARYARRLGAQHMIILTSVGASDHVDNHYLNTKGVVERELGKMGFDRLDILRPGLLRGDRREWRLAEYMGRAIVPLIDPMLVGSLRKFRSIAASDVAKAIWTLTCETQNGHFIHHFDDLMRLAD